LADIAAKNAELIKFRQRQIARMCPYNARVCLAGENEFFWTVNAATQAVRQARILGINLERADLLLKEIDRAASIYINGRLEILAESTAEIRAALDGKPAPGGSSRPSDLFVRMPANKPRDAFNSEIHDLLSAMKNVMKLGGETSDFSMKLLGAALWTALDVGAWQLKMAADSGQKEQAKMLQDEVARTLDWMKRNTSGDEHIEARVLSTLSMAKDALAGVVRAPP
jgi:hypothetical protein